MPQDAPLTHPFLGPLTIVQGYAEMLADGQLADPLLVRSSAREILASAQHIARLLEAAQTSAPTEVEPGEIEPRLVELTDWLTQKTATFARTTPSHQVVADLPSALPPARIDPRRLGQAFEMLLASAARASEPGSLILVTAHVFAAGSVEIHILDQGTASGPDGARLAEARGVVEAHGGQIGVRSTLGRGSTVWLRLPSEVARVPSDPPVWIEDLEEALVA